LHQPDSLKYLRKLAGQDQRTLNFLGEKLPSRAMVYTQSQDKVMWSNWKIGTIGEPKRTAVSMQRAIDAGLPVYIVQPRFGGKLKPLERALHSRRINVTPLDAKRGVYRLRRATAA
jgi:hypothetical protein